MYPWNSCCISVLIFAFQFLFFRTFLLIINLRALISHVMIFWETFYFVTLSCVIILQEIVSLMKLEGHTPNLYTYGIMASSCRHATDGFQLLDDMQVLSAALGGSVLKFYPIVNNSAISW